MRNLNILAREALKQVTSDPLYRVSVRVDYDRTWTYKLSIAYRDVILFEQDMVFTEVTQEEIQKKFLVTIQYVLIEEDYMAWIDFITGFDDTPIPDYANDESTIYWTGIDATIYAPNLEAAQRAYEEWTGEKGNVGQDKEGVFYAD